MVATIGRNRSTVPTRKSMRYTIRSPSETRKILAYLGNAVPNPAGAKVRAPSGDGLTGLMLCPPFFKHLGNHLVQRRILHAHVDNGVPVEDGGKRFGDAPAVHFELGDRPLPAGYLAV